MGSKELLCLKNLAKCLALCKCYANIRVLKLFSCILHGYSMCTFACVFYETDWNSGWNTIEIIDIWDSY